MHSRVLLHSAASHLYQAQRVACAAGRHRLHCRPPSAQQISGVQPQQEGRQQRKPARHRGFLDERLEQYLWAHTREPPLLARLREDTRQQFPSGLNMQINPDQGAFMAWLVSALRVERMIEVGVFTGYSSTVMAMALPPHGRLVACDRDPKAMALARKYWAEAGVAGKVDERLGPAKESLEALLAEPSQHHSYDFAFIDADKKGYADYYEQLLKLVRPGGVIALDNVLWYGRVADPEDQTPNTQAIRDLNAFLLADERVTLSIVPVGDGIALCTKR